MAGEFDLYPVSIGASLLSFLLRNVWLARQCERTSTYPEGGNEPARGNENEPESDLRTASDATELENGAFGEWIVAKGDLQIKIPDNLSYEQAATLGRSINIVVCTMYPCPPS